MCNVLIVEYSLYGHIYKMAEAVAEGVREVSGCKAVIKRVPETLSDEVLGKMGAIEAQKKMAHIPVASVDDLAAADAIIFGAPTRFGSMCGQMRQFLDASGGLWMKGALIGKPGSVFTSSASHHKGAGINNPQLPRHPVAPGYGSGGTTLCVCRTVGICRSNRLQSLWRVYHHGWSG